MSSKLVDFGTSGTVLMVSMCYINKTSESICKLNEGKDMRKAYGFLITKRFLAFCTDIDQMICKNVVNFDFEKRFFNVD